MRVGRFVQRIEPSILVRNIILQVKTLPANCAISVSDSEVEENITDLHDEVQRAYMKSLLRYLTENVL